MLRDRPDAGASMRYRARARGMGAAIDHNASPPGRAIPMCAFARTLLRLLGRVPIALALLAAVVTR